MIEQRTGDVVVLKAELDLVFLGELQCSGHVRFASNGASNSDREGSEVRMSHVQIGWHRFLVGQRV
jgi:hypothetical protein